MFRRLAIWLALLLSAGAPLCAQSIHPPINQPVFRAFDANGNPLAGGKLYTYAAGTSTPLATYSDAGAVTPNTNPVVLDSSGQAKVFLGFSNYKFVLEDANGVQQWTVDNISGSPTTNAVTSVFGRTGAILALTGDYTCSQITGAVCSTPTIYYQNLMAGGTTVSPQRNTLNLISGTGLAVTCADNSTTSATDCTFATSGGTVTPRTCNANGCYQIDSDGTITQWGRTAPCSSGSNECTVAVTFPYPFTTTANLTVTVTAAGTTTGKMNVVSSVFGTPTTSNFTAGFSAVVYVGGTGDNLNGTAYGNWIAKGN